MAIINKTDLVYTDYSWTAIKGDDPKISGEPDSTLFNKHEGYEMLYLLNKMVKNGIAPRATAQKAERLIRQHLPGSIRSQTNVYKWVVDNWDSYK
jgi:hypothetical protein